MTALAAAAAVALCGFAAGPAHAAASCDVPGSTWQKVSPAEAGMDASKLQEAMDYGSANLGFSVRVYRHGCLVAEDRAAPLNRNAQFESWSMAKSVTALIFGRAMTLGLISPDDPVGSLVPEADKAHGAITVRDLLTQSSGLRWNGFRDYNIFTMPDRVRDALTLDPVKKPGTYFEYAQSPVALIAEAVGRSTGEDVQSFGQRQLFDPIGIPASAWTWRRDPAGHVQGFFGVNIRPDDFARLGELMRRGGNWGGRNLLGRTFLTQAVTPSRTNGCYGWLIWLNAGAPCIGPTVGNRPVSQTREFPDLPADMYHFSGLFGQLVTVFPSQGIVVVRTGQDPGLAFAGGAGWEHGLYQKVLGAVTDQKITPPGPAPNAFEDRTNSDYGFQTALREPDQYSKGVAQDPLPPAGPARARAAQLRLARKRASRNGFVWVRIACPPRGALGCTGSARLTSASRAVTYTLGAGNARLLRFRLTKAALADLRRAGAADLTVTAVNRDAGGGTPASAGVTVKSPKA